jgi:hypothetical protein
MSRTGENVLVVLDNKLLGKVEQNIILEDRDRIQVRLETGDASEYKGETM